jgi:hypothetical protein
MNRFLLVAFLALSGCALRVGTDTTESANGLSDGTFLLIATWSKDSADTTRVTRRDTLTLDSLSAAALPVADSTILALRSLSGTWGAWLGPRSRTLTLRETGRPLLRWRDSRHRQGLTFLLPGTGVETLLDTSEGWKERTISVFAQRWPARIVHASGGRRVVWSIDSLRLEDTLRLDLSILPDSSCPIQPGADPSLWECRPR